MSENHVRQQLEDGVLRLTKINTGPRQGMGTWFGPTAAFFERKGWGYPSRKAVEA